MIRNHTRHINNEERIIKGQCEEEEQREGSPAIPFHIIHDPSLSTKYVSCHSPPPPSPARWPCPSTPGWARRQCCCHRHRHHRRHRHWRCRSHAAALPPGRMAPRIPPHDPTRTRPLPPGLGSAGPVTHPRRPATPGQRQHHPPTGTALPRCGATPRRGMPSRRGAAADCRLGSFGRSHPPPPLPCPGAPADCRLGRRQETPASPPSPAQQLIVIWVVWLAYLSPPRCCNRP